MASFAERMGFRETRTLAQTDSLDNETRIELWNVLNALDGILSKARAQGSSTQSNLLSAVWTWEFKEPADEEPTVAGMWLRIKRVILQGEWFDALDLVEAVAGYLDRYKTSSTTAAVSAMTDAFNNRFEHFLVGYRFIDMKITPIESTAAAEAVEAAINDITKFAGAHHHLGQAVEHLADRDKPDYPNSIKESISAVEAVCVAVSGEKTLGAAIKALKNAGVTIHPALERAWSSMYGWTSNADGLRHGGIDAPDADQALAKYMLVTCSAFVSYVVQAASKSGLV